MDVEKYLNQFIDDVGDDQTVLRYIYNSGKKFIPFETPVYYSGPYWDHSELKAAVKALLLGKWLSSGESVRKFEIAFSKKFNFKSSLMVNSGSSANLVMIAAIKKTLGWKDGDEIILSSVGFPTTIAPVVQNNLSPKFIDIEWDTLNFDLTKIENQISDKTKAILISPVLGNAPDFDVLIKLKEKYNLELILDNCDSLGSRWRGKILSDYCLASSCSFYPSHHISTGEGGMVSSNIKEIVITARSMAWWGRDCYCVGSANLLPDGTCGKRFHPWLEDQDLIVDHKYIFLNIGYNLKPLDLQGSIGLVQLEKFEEIHKKRKNAKKRIQDLFENSIKGIFVPNEIEHADTSWFGTPVVCEDETEKKHLVNYLEKNMIQTRPFFAGNILAHEGYKHLGDYRDYPNANQILRRVFFVGSSPHYDDDTFNYIETVLSDYVRKF